MSSRKHLPNNDALRLSTISILVVFFSSLLYVPLFFYCLILAWLVLPMVGKELDSTIVIGARHNAPIFPRVFTLSFVCLPLVMPSSLPLPLPRRCPILRGLRSLSTSPFLPLGGHRNHFWVFLWVFVFLWGFCVGLFFFFCFFFFLYVFFWLVGVLFVGFGGGGCGLLCLWVLVFFFVGVGVPLFFFWFCFFFFFWSEFKRGEDTVSASSPFRHSCISM